ncbi:MAG: nuclear transport factor 2 family protein [Fodinibius sp.]|nr:nuclear transport factor 2 family protein [Fodinibius sp.]
MKKYLIVLFLGMATLLSCQAPDQQAGDSEAAVDSVLDDWHEAAADADFERYFAHFASDSAIFMGTDATERWTVSEFKAYAKPYFDNGEAWDFTPVERHIYFSDNGKTAWFDESLETPNLGPTRGTGVLVRQKEDWKIAHYNLSIPIPNAIADTVVGQVKKALNNQSK